MLLFPAAGTLRRAAAGSNERWNKNARSPVVIALLACRLPFALRAGGLTLTSATDVVIFSIACMALNLLVGNTGLVSFGHGAWFGLGAYAAALAQRHWFAGSIVWPSLFAVAFLLVASALVGFLVLRRRGVYFSLLTLAFSALTYAVAFRWTAFTGGENGLGGVTRAVWLNVDLANPWVYYVIVAAIGLAVVYALSRFHTSPIGTVLNAIRENEQRAQFIGYATQRYKQIAFMLSATLTGFAGVLFAFHHRFASADPTAISFSGELLAMVIIGGMRSLLGPALGALFYILFREYLSIWTPNWLLFFGLLFVGFVVFSPTGLVGVWRRITAPLRAKVVEAAAMAGRTIEQGMPMPAFLCRERKDADTRFTAQGLAKKFGGIHAVRASITVADRPLDALIGPNGAGSDRLQSHIRPVRARPRTRRPRRPGPHGTASASDRRGGARTLVPDHEPVPVAVDRGEPATRRAGERCQSFRRLEARRVDPDRHRQDHRLVRFRGSPASSARRPGRCRTAGSGSSTWGSRWRPRRGSCCSTSRWRGWPQRSGSG
jgi:ABC-type branched-subunit amino acid transport system permease subunit